MSSSACRRSRWKYCAAVVQLAIRRLMSAAGGEEAFRARARVLGPLAFVAVRQQQHQRRRLPPLGARRGDELVEDDLRAVDEVAVLALPDDQPVRGLHVVAVLEPDRGVLAERAVVDLEAGLRLRQALQRDVDGAGLGVVERRVAMAERAALHVLAGQPDRDAVGQDAREREFLGGGPVDRALVAIVEDAPCGARGRDRACGDR